MTEKVTLGLVQFAAVEDADENRRKALELANDAAGRGAELVILHELITTQYFPAFAPDDRFFDLAEPIDGRTLTEFRKLAISAGVAFLVPWFEQLSPGRFVNSAALVTSEGSIQHVWRKTHIPRVQVPSPDGLIQVDEKYYFEPWPTAPSVVQWNGVNIGVLICHDRHFPEASRCLAVSGAELIVVPSTSRGIPEVADPVMAWSVELQAMAIQNIAFVAATNRVGVEQHQEFLGHSLIYGPGGDEIAMAGGEEAVVIASIEPRRVATTRVARGFFRDRRPETYGALTADPLSGPAAT